MNEAENKREYEMSFLLTPEIAEDKLDFEAEELKKLILESGGTDIETTAPQNKRLAYPVKKQNRAYLGVVYFNIDSGDLDKMKSVLALNTKVLRFLILNKPFKSRIEPVRHIPEISLRAPEALPREEKAVEIPIESFDKKLESILNG